MRAFAIKGWCPDAWHPMATGDGLLVRVRPRLARLTRAQVLILCEAALAYGNGLFDLTSRANLQLRGVRDSAMPALLATLVEHDLASADAVIETRRNLLLAPDWHEGDDTARIANELTARLHELPELPGKVGFVIDAGPRLALAGEDGDFRVERGRDGGLILRAAGRMRGAALDRGGEADALIALAHWFVASGGVEAGRMTRHPACLPPFAEGELHPASGVGPITAGSHEFGRALGIPFGQIDARTLGRLATSSTMEALRLTPWRLVLVEGLGDDAGFIRDADDPLLRVDACPGQPVCPQATVETRALARRLAPHVEGRLHVSGCAKGCARTVPADLTLTGREGLFDLATGAHAGAPPLQTGLTTAEILAHFGAA